MLSFSQTTQHSMDADERRREKVSPVDVYGLPRTSPTEQHSLRAIPKLSEESPYRHIHTHTTRASQVYGMVKR